MNGIQRIVHFIWGIAYALAGYVAFFQRDAAIGIGPAVLIAVFFVVTSFYWLLSIVFWVADHWNDETI